jgi:Lrp/AsnC family leucine-responsive transcriptional regulator
MSPTKDSIQLDDADRALLRALQRNDRRPYGDLGKEIHLSPAAAHARVRKLQKAGIITGYHARVDPARLGYRVTGFVSVQLAPDATVFELAPALEAIEEIDACHSTAGADDLLIRVRATDPQHLERVVHAIRRLDGVVRTNTTVGLSIAFERPELSIPEGAEQPTSLR